MQATKWSNSGQSSEEGASLTSAFYIMGSSHWMSFICCFLTVILPKYSHIFHPGSCRRFKFGVYSDAKSNDHTLPDVCMVSFTSTSSKKPIGIVWSRNFRVHTFFSWVVGQLNDHFSRLLKWRGEKSSSGFELRPVDGRAEYFLTKNSKANRT